MSYNTRSAEEMVPFIMDYIKPKTVLDVGCGIGTWLKVFSKYTAVSNLLGIDGDYVKKEEFLIAKEQFMPVDLNKAFLLKNRYDLVISLEVGEHLEESAADAFIKSLTNHADVIIFSAAVPYQGGDRHLNSQWPDYWRSKFNSVGFNAHDTFRRRFWNNENINWWYRQNMFLYVKKGFMPEKFNQPEPTLLTFIHPELLKKKAGQADRPEIKEAFIKLIKALKPGFSFKKY